jgi:hypothetical protein
MRILILALGMTVIAGRLKRAEMPIGRCRSGVKHMSEKEAAARATVRRPIAWKWSFRLPLETPRTMPFRPEDDPRPRLLVQP